MDFTRFGQKAKNNKIWLISGIITIIVIIIVIVTIIIIKPWEKNEIPAPISGSPAPAISIGSPEKNIGSLTTNESVESINKNLTNGNPEFINGGSSEPVSGSSESNPEIINGRPTPINEAIENVSRSIPQNLNTLPYSTDFDYHFYAIDPTIVTQNNFDLKQDGPGVTTPDQCIQECKQNQNCKMYCTGPDGCNQASNNQLLYGISVGSSWNCATRSENKPPIGSAIKTYYGALFDKTKSTEIPCERSCEGSDCTKCRDFNSRDTKCYQFSTKQEFGDALIDIGKKDGQSLYFCQSK